MASIQNHGFDDVEAKTFTKPVVLRATTWGPLKWYRLLDDRGYRTGVAGFEASVERASVL